MKKIIVQAFLFVLMLLPLSAIAADTTAPKSITTSPTTYALDQPVTITFDMTGSSFVAGQDLYMWAWSPSEPDAGNIANSSDFAKLEYVSGMIWKKTMTPTVYFSKTVAEIEASAGIWMRLKGKDAALQSGVFTVPYVSSLVAATTGAPKGITVLPANYSLDQSVTWTFDMTGTDFTEGQDLYMWAWQPSEPDKGNFNNSSDFAKLEYVSGKIWKKTLVPTDYFKMTPAEIKAASSQFYMKIKTKSKALTSATFNVPFGQEPTLVVFPSKFSILDVVQLTRKFNENAVVLKYTVTAGAKSITGDFTGTQAEMKVAVDLNLLNQPGVALDKINIVIKKDGTDLPGVDYPLVPLTEVE